MEKVATQCIDKMIIINAQPAQVWNAIADVEIMKQWMSETEIEILTDWQVGGAFIIRGAWYKTAFENKGRILQYNPMYSLQYSHLSSLSRLPDRAENYTTVHFKLSPEEDSTILNLTLCNFPTESIYHHFNFYWNVSLHMLKKLVENKSD